MADDLKYEDERYVEPPPKKKETLGQKAASAAKTVMKTAFPIAEALFKPRAQEQKQQQSVKYVYQKGRQKRRQKTRIVYVRESHPIDPFDIPDPFEGGGSRRRRRDSFDDIF